MQTTVDIRKTEIKEKLEKVFDKRQASVLTEVISDAYSDLVKTSDFNELKGIVKELGVKVGELAEAQKRTEAELRELVMEHKKTRTLVGNLSDTVGYGLEDKIMPYMYDFGKKEYGIEVEVVERRNIEYPDGKYDEVNIYVEGKRDGERAYIIGECKSQPGKRDADDFHKLIKRLKEYLTGEVNAFLVGYAYSPEVERYIKGKYPEIRLTKSFEFGLKYKMEG